VDDGSTDESPNILREYEEKDKRFYVVHQQNGGPGKARNTGFDLATGKYLIFLDSDDWFEKKMLEDMTDEAEKTKADIFAKVNITRLVLALYEEGCELLSIREREESLENYYINLVGGGKR